MYPPSASSQNYFPAIFLALISSLSLGFAAEPSPRIALEIVRWVNEEKVPETKTAIFTVSFNAKTRSEFFALASQFFLGLEKDDADFEFHDEGTNLNASLFTFTTTKAAVAKRLASWKSNPSISRVGAVRLGDYRASLKKIDRVQESYFAKANFSSLKGNRADQKLYVDDNDTRMRPAYETILEIISNEFDWQSRLSPELRKVLAAAVLTAEVAFEYQAGGDEGKYPLAEDFLSFISNGYEKRFDPLNIVESLEKDGDPKPEDNSYIWAMAYEKKNAKPGFAKRTYVRLFKQVSASEYLFALNGRTLYHRDGTTSGVLPKGYAYRRTDDSPDYAPEFQLTKDNIVVE